MIIHLWVLEPFPKINHPGSIEQYVLVNRPGMRSYFTREDPLKILDEQIKGESDKKSAYNKNRPFDYFLLQSPKETGQRDGEQAQAIHKGPMTERPGKVPEIPTGDDI